MKTQDPPRAKRDPKHREKRTGDGPVLRGEALQLEICRLRETMSKPIAFAEIGRRLGCAADLVSRVCGLRSGAARRRSMRWVADHVNQPLGLVTDICKMREAEQEPADYAEIARLVGCSRAYAAKVCAATTEDKDRFPPEVFGAILAHLRSGAEVKAALDIPGVADLFPMDDPRSVSRGRGLAPGAPADAARRRRAETLLRWISYGRDAEEGSQKRDLWLARQDGKEARRAWAAAVVKMREEGLAPKTIAERLGVPVGSVRTALAREAKDAA